jgi:hypothetical protein
VGSALLGVRLLPGRRVGRLLGLGPAQAAERLDPELHQLVAPVAVELLQADAEEGRQLLPEAEGNRRSKTSIQARQQ